MPAQQSDPRGRERFAEVLGAIDAGIEADPAELKAAVRYSLQLFAARHPGKALELRVPPVAAVQCLAGPAHTRGTPPNVVETDPVTWLRLAAGRLEWAAAVRSAALSASGPRADLTGYLPILG